MHLYIFVPLYVHLTPLTIPVSRLIIQKKNKGAFLLALLCDYRERAFVFRTYNKTTWRGDDSMCEKNKYGKLNSYRLKGSITVEAAIVLPVFILLIISMMNFFVVINYQNIMQFNVFSSALSVGRLSYTMDRLEDIKNKEEAIENIGINSNLIYSGINTAYVSEKIFTEELKDYTNEAGVVNGVRGVLVTSTVEEKTLGINDIKVNYRMEFSIMGNKKYNLRMANCCYFRSWIGESLKETSKEGESAQKVYITQNGKVYHLKKNCTYINIIVVKVKLSYIDNFRNESGGKYYECEICAKKSSNKKEDVFITASGTRYHYDESCRKIDRDVIEVDISNIGERKVCSRCSN